MKLSNFESQGAASFISVSGNGVTIWVPSVSREFFSCMSCRIRRSHPFLRCPVLQQPAEFQDSSILQQRCSCVLSATSFECCTIRKTQPRGTKGTKQAGWCASAASSVWLRLSGGFFVFCWESIFSSVVIIKGSTVIRLKKEGHKLLH